MARIYFFLSLFCIAQAFDCPPLYIWGGATFLFSLPKYNDTYCVMTAITRSDSRVSVNCSSLDLPENVYMEVEENGLWKAFKEDFQVTGESFKIKLNAPPDFHLDVSCNLTSTIADHKGVPVDNCRCGYTEGVKYLPHALLVNATRSPVCGATVISKRIALTAAQCIYNRDVNDQYHLKIANKLIMDEIGVFAFIVHENYSNPTGVEFDIGLIVTIEDMTLFPPACLPFVTPPNLGGKKVKVITGDHDKNLLSTSYQVCHEQYILSNKSLICLISKPPAATKMTPGGPIFYENPHKNQFYIVGIVTHPTTNCASGYCNFHTRVDHFLPWISTQINHHLPGQKACIV